MRKNYFAKKFVAYSMAFAVAFSTLTVSPVFVKEAKADPTFTAPAVGAMTSVTGDQFIIGNVTTNVAASTSNITLADVAKNINGAIATGGSKNTFYLTFTKGEDTKDVTNGTIKTLYKYETVDFAANMFKATSADPAVAAPVLVDFTADNPGEIDASVTSGATNYKIADSGVKWFKLEPIHGSFSHSTGITATPTETISYDAYYLSAVTETSFGDDSDDGKLTFKKGKVSKNDCGLYLALKSDDSVSAVFNVIQDTKLKAAPERDEFIVKSGSDANLIVHASNNSGNISYSWRKGTTTLSSTSDVCKIEKVDGTKTGNYTCVVSDGSGEVTLRNIKLSVSESALGVKPVYKTVVKGLAATTDGDTKQLIGGTAELTSSVPANENYRYVWLDKNNSVASVTAANILNYDAKNNNIVINDNTDKYDVTTNAHAISCYTLTADDYEALEADVRPATPDGIAEKIGDLLVELSKAKNDVEKKEINDYIRAIEDANGTAITGAVITKSLYQEDYIFVPEDDKLTNSVNLVKAVGDNVICEAPSKDLYTKCTKAGHPASETITATPGVSFVRTELQGNDFGNHSISTTYTCSNVTPDTKTATTYYNIIYKSDLTASAESANIVAKIGAKDVELKVNASSACGLDYTWTKYTVHATPTQVTSKVIETSKTSTHKISTVEGTDIYVPEKLDELGNLVAHDYNYYECEVSNGIEKKVIKFTLSQEGGYKVYDQKPADGTQVNAARNDNGATSFTVNGMKAIPGKNIVLNPYVVADKGVNITYKWYDITNSKEILSTTDILDIPYTKPVTYVCVISDGENEFKLKYSLTNAAAINGDVYVYLRDEDEIEDQVYTGKEITPELNVGFAIDSDGDRNLEYDIVSKLVAGTDYLVEYVENVNVGEARVKVTPTGLYKGETETFKFYINRADNTLEIADKTVVLGGSVQPKTVKNTAKATLSYAYFTDAACTNEIEVPSKVGTYYVKATSAATLNYKEATSNVAKVVIAPGTTKIGNTSRSASAIKLNWSKVAGANKYRVYIKKSGKWTKVADTTALSYTVKGLASATTYQFAVKAFAGSIASPKYVTRQTTTAPAKVATPAVTAKGSGKVAVSYGKVTRATGYQVYMAKGNGSYKKVAQGKLTAITKSKLTKGATYKFKVRAYKTVGSNVYYGAFSSAKAVKVK